MNKLLSLMVMLSFSVFASSDEKKADVGKVVVNIPITVEGEAKGKPNMPTEVASTEELNKILGEEQGKKVAKNIDFKENKVLYFAWSGSGRDQVAPSVDAEKKLVTFKFTAGLTRDFRPHHKLFVIDKNYKVEFSK